MSMDANKDLVRAYVVAFSDRDEACGDRRVVVMDDFRVAHGRRAEHWALMDNPTVLKHIGASAS